MSARLGIDLLGSPSVRRDALAADLDSAGTDVVAPEKKSGTAA